MHASVQLGDVLASAVARLLRPLVRMLLAHGFSFAAFTELARRAYVDVAVRDFAIPGKRQTISRVSILTGLSRKEVQRVLHERESLEHASVERYNRAARVIAGWVRDRTFTDTHDQPIPLPIENGATSFTSLVRRYSGDMPAKAVLDELLRVGAVERQGDGSVRLLTRAYVPRASAIDKLCIMGMDTADLLDTIDHNLEHGASNPFFQRKVMYDNLPIEACAELRALSAERAQKLLERLDEWLARHDRDVSPNVGGTGRRRAGLGIYYFEEDLEPQRQGSEHGHEGRTEAR